MDVKHIETSFEKSRIPMKRSGALEILQTALFCPAHEQGAFLKSGIKRN